MLQVRNFRIVRKGSEKVIKTAIPHLFYSFF